MIKSAPQDIETMVLPRGGCVWDTVAESKAAPMHTRKIRGRPCIAEHLPSIRLYGCVDDQVSVILLALVATRRAVDAKHES